MEIDKFLDGIFEPNKDMELSGKVTDYSPLIILQGGDIPKDKFIRFSEKVLRLKNIVMEQSELTSIAQQGTRVVPVNNEVQWVTCTPTEQDIIVFDTETHKATHYFRARPDKDVPWYDWRIKEEIDLQ